MLPSAIVRLLSAEHPPKRLSPRVVTVDGITTLFRWLALIKAQKPILFKPSGRATPVTVLQSKKAQGVIDDYATMDAMSKELSPYKGLDMSKMKIDNEEDSVSGVPSDVGGAFADKLALLRTQVQKTNDERAAERKAALIPLSVTEAGIAIAFNPCALKKQDCLMAVIDGGMVIPESDASANALSPKATTSYIPSSWTTVAGIEMVP